MYSLIIEEVILLSEYLYISSSVAYKLKYKSISLISSIEEGFNEILIRYLGILRIVIIGRTIFSNLRAEILYSVDFRNIKIALTRVVARRSIVAEYTF